MKLGMIRKLFGYSLKNISVNAIFTVTVFQIFLQGVKGLMKNKPSNIYSIHSDMNRYICKPIEMNRLLSNLYFLTT